MVDISLLAADGVVCCDGEEEAEVEGAADSGCGGKRCDDEDDECVLVRL